MDKAADRRRNEEIRKSANTQMLLRVESSQYSFTTVMPSHRAVSVMEILNDDQVIKVDANIDIEVRQPRLKMSPRKREAIELYDRREMIQKPSKTIDLSNYF